MSLLIELVKVTVYFLQWITVHACTGSNDNTLKHTFCIDIAYNIINICVCMLDIDI